MRIRFIEYPNRLLHNQEKLVNFDLVLKVNNFHEENSKALFKSSVLKDLQ